MEIEMHVYPVGAKLPDPGSILTVLCGKQVRYVGSVPPSAAKTIPCRACRERLTQLYKTKKYVGHINLSEPPRDTR